jgi:S1-C subfamily serine protease
MIWTKQQGYEPPGIMTAKELYGDNPPPANNNEADGMGQMAKMMAALMGPGKGKSEPRGYIGIEVDKVDASDIVITAVHEKSPAAEAGLKKDDVILEVGGRKVRTLAGLLNKTFSPGDEVTFKVKRGDEEKELTVKVGRGL